jgi:threonine synthase
MKATASEAILKGLSKDGGLFVPMKLDELKISLDTLENKNYQQIAQTILALFFQDFREDQIVSSVEKAYDNKFCTDEIVPIVKVGEDFIMELFHGKTLAFKDIALSILPYLMKYAQENCQSQEHILILTATSGDTGKAALEGFKGVKGIDIIVFYPEEGVSQIQKLQMITQEGENTHVVSIKGNFDDAQNGVKIIFNDLSNEKELESLGIKLSSANSINIGRLVPQITYYFTTYEKLVSQSEIKRGEFVNFVVPTGNFGNILAGYFAKRMGLPINKLICASNENHVLRDFIHTGIYDVNRDFVKTNSPSMDILISSNLERLLYYLSGQDNDYITSIMTDLKTKKHYEVNDTIKEKLKDEFWSSYCTESETLETIKLVYDKHDYVMDTHTAVAYKASQDYKKATNDKTKTVILSTASPYKFIESVYQALFGVNSHNDFKLLKALSEITKRPIPKSIAELENMKIIHDRKCQPTGMFEEILKIVKEDIAL